MPKKKNRTLIGVAGIILAIFGLTVILPVYLKSTNIPGLSLGTVLVVGGILLFAWSVSD